MKKSTYRIVKSIGMVLFLILFGVFVFLLIKPQKNETDQVAFSPEVDSEDLEIFPGTGSENKQIGFDYLQNTEGESRDV